MKLLNVDSWPNYLRWMLFLPISILVYIPLSLYVLISDWLNPGSSYLLIFLFGVACRPLAAYVAMYIVPKAKVAIGYIYLSLFLLDFIMRLLTTYIHIIKSTFTWHDAGILLSVIIGILITLAIVRNKHSELKKNKN